MGLGTDEQERKPKKRTVVVLEQGKRDRTRYTVVQTINTIAWQVGRKINSDQVQAIIDGARVEVVVRLKK